MNHRLLTRRIACVIFIAVILSFSSANYSNAAISVRCVSVVDSNSPARMAHSLGHDDKDLQTSIWCYEDRSSNTRKLTLVYKVDGLEAKPELSALVETDKSGAILNVTHGSLARGKISIHKMSGFLSPFGVPLSYEEALKAGAKSIDPLDLQVVALSHNAFQALADYRGPRIAAALKEGVFEANVTDDRLPFDGYWWDNRGLPLAAGPNSPLGKYDAIIKSWTGTDPQSVAWEASHHADTSVPWGGHCNGWAASSVLYQEPTKFLWDAANRKVILPSDIKGMLSETSFCVNMAFFGSRYWGNPGDDLNEISPDRFHKVLAYYIGGLNKTVLLDYFPDDQIDNNILGGYKFTITKVASDPNKFRVVAEVKKYDYNRDRLETPGKALHHIRVYEYFLTVDARGEVSGGEWISENPDFLWVALSPASGSCGWRNEKMDPKQVVRISQTLPEAKLNSVDVNFEINGPIAKEAGRFSVPLPAMTAGTYYTVHYEMTGLRDYEPYLEGSGENAHPTDRSMGQTSVGSFAYRSEKTVVLLVSNLNSMGIHFWYEQGAEFKMKILKIEYYGEP